MKTYRPRREFIKRLLALPLLATAPPLAAAAVRDYDVYLFPVAGFQFHDGPQLLAHIRPGMALALVAEPHNRHDPRAIRIEAHGRHIGYVPRSDNGPLGRLIAQGAPLRARVLSVRREGEPWDAVRVAVSMPANPARGRSPRRSVRGHLREAFQGQTHTLEHSLKTDP